MQDLNIYNTGGTRLGFLESSVGLVFKFCWLESNSDVGCGPSANLACVQYQGFYEPSEMAPSK